MHEAWLVAAILAGMIAGGLAVLVLRPDRRPALAAAEAARDAATLRIAALEQAAGREAEARLADRQQLEAQAKEIGGLRTRAEALAAQLGEQAETRAALAEKFRLLAAETLEATTKRLVEQSRERLDPMLKPLADQLGDFRKRVDEVYAEEAKQRIGLEKQIEATLKVSQLVGTQADALAQALKGQSQTRGHLGEVMLEQVLQAAGLEPDVSYVVQGKGMEIRTEDGSRQRPDVIVRLPDEKCIIIDSKVALVDFLAWADAADDAARERAMASFRAAVRGHVNDLSRKHYPDAVKLRSTDFVLLFMPFEAALGLALRADPDLFAMAWQKGIALVGPNTLMMAMRVVAETWSSERSRRSASEIVEVAAKLYDQLADASRAFAKARAAIAEAGRAHDEGVGRLFEIRGNVRARADQLRKLGVKNRKEIVASSPDALGAADGEDEDDAASDRKPGRMELPAPSPGK